jgi:2-polyprenyl-3-methyl-5-hydroxy-6-metoxy-1,4-benzoquinol methylase
MSGHARHKYDYGVDQSLKSAPAAVIRMAGRKKRVLDVGAGPGSITKILATDSQCAVTAVEIDLTAVERLREFCESVHLCDLNEPQWEKPLEVEAPFDVVVLADVLEHLYDPQSVLAECSRLLAPNGVAVVSIPHAGHSAVIACLLESDVAYQEYGLLDRTHIRFFGLKNMQEMFDSAGLRIVETEFVVRSPEQTELAVNWRRLGRPLKSALSDSPYGNLYQVVVKAEVGPPDRSSIRLLDVPIPPPGTDWPSHTMSSNVVGRLKAAVLPYLSADTRMRIKHALSRLGIRL